MKKKNNVKASDNHHNGENSAGMGLMWPNQRMGIMKAIIYNGLSAQPLQAV